MKFEIHKITQKNSRHKGQFYFNLKANNGEIVATSETYNTKQGCQKGIRAVKKCMFAKVVDLTVWENESD